MQIDFNLKKEVKVFTNDVGDSIEYTSYYIQYGVVKIYLKPNDKTAKELLESIDFNEKK